MEGRVRDFLIRFKEAITEHSGVYLVNRESTLATLAYLGLTKRHVEEILLDLSTEDYSQGPEPDRDRPGEVWVFGVRLEGVPHEIYIKVKLVETEGGPLAKCLSFHIAKYLLAHPFRDREGGTT